MIVRIRILSTQRAPLLHIRSAAATSSVATGGSMFRRALLLEIKPDLIFFANGFSKKIEGGTMISYNSCDYL
jgi:hypothetical protein